MPEHLVLRYARELGWPMLPCWWIENGRCACPLQTALNDPEGKCNPGKHPFPRFAPHGVKDASASPSQIATWLDREPRCNWAVATGPGSGVLVLDVDGPAGERSLVELERRYGPLPEWYPQQWTGSGGNRWQAFLAYPEGRQIGNSAGKLGPGIDTRATGGYALVPPSKTKMPYRWAPDRVPLVLPLEPAPDWLVDLLDPPAQVPGKFSPTRPAHADQYGWRAMESELALLVTAREGRRNDQLNRSAHSLYRLVTDGRLHRDDVDYALTAAAQHTGLQDREIVSTLASAARARGLP